MYSFLNNSVFFWSLFICFNSVLTSCDRLYSNNLSGENYSGISRDLATEDKIAVYADSINAVLPFCEETKSMVYTLGDYSFQVSRFKHHDKIVLYIEQGNNGEYRSVEKRYYIEDNMPALLVERSVDSRKSLRYSNTYFKQGKVFIAEQKSGSAKEMNIQNAGFKEASLEAVDHYQELETYEDALNQRRKFDLVFEEIAECPKAKYLILSRKEINSYRAPVKVEVEDEFIRELYSNPLRYRGEKLDISWKINSNNETVYLQGRLKTRD